MSLRYRLTTVAVAILLLNVVVLGVWYILFLQGPVMGDLSITQEKLDGQVKALALELSQSDDPRAFLRKQAEELGCEITLENAEGRSVCRFSGEGETKLLIRSTALVTIEQAPHLLTIGKAFDIKGLAESSQARSLIWVEIWIAGIILVFTSGVVYFLYVRPVEELDEDVRAYRHGKRPEGTDRSDEIGKLRNSFVDLTLKLEDEKNKQSRIIASISHDIKTPLTSVMGYAECIKRGGLNEERTARYVDTIYQKSLAIRDLINEFDAYISCNIRNSFRPCDADTGDIIAMLRDEYEDEITTLGVDFTLENRCGQELLLSYDASQLRRVFGNIFGNSIKHMKGSSKSISVTLSHGEDCLLIAIADNGTGVPEENLEKIFEALYTSDAGRSVAGLGLAICREAIGSTHAPFIE